MPDLLPFAPAVTCPVTMRRHPVLQAMKVVVFRWKMHAVCNGELPEETDRSEVLRSYFLPRH